MSRSTRPAARAPTELHFNAVASRPTAARALQSQAREALRPFDNYLRQAIRTTKARQTQYALPWTRVRQQRVYGLDPLDGRLWVPRPRPRWRVGGLPAAVEPTVTPLMDVTASRAVEIAAAGRDAAGVWVEPAPEEAPPGEGSAVFWSGHPVTVTVAPPPGAPGSIVVDGDARAVRHAEVHDGGWALVIEGKLPSEPVAVRVDGQAVDDRRVTDGRPKRVYDPEASGHPGWAVERHAVTLDEPLEPAVVVGDDHVRYRRYPRDRKARGEWVELGLPDGGEDDELPDTLDPRAAFVEDQVREVWVGPRKHGALKVLRVDRERYRLCLEALPPADCAALYLPVDVRNLERQRRALHQLRYAPMPFHQGLLRLCEHPEHVRWPRVRPKPPAVWRVLTDAARDGTEAQRMFVAQVLGGLDDAGPAGGDVTLLEGPPGSGKTTAICELVLQLIERGLRVLLCASTHFAIDNVIERLIERDDAPDIVRIGRLDKVDDRVAETQIDHRVDALQDAWRRRGALGALGDGEREAAARRLVVEGADLTCGTTMGITHHPAFELPRGKRPWMVPGCTRPLWDVLIVDEASKTTIAEFMVPALCARRWVIVGDVHQLPPFADRAEIKASVGALVDRNDRPLMPLEHQRACWIIELLRGASTPARWLVAEPPAVLDHLAAEWAATPRDDGPTVARVLGPGERPRRQPSALLTVSVDAIERGEPAALALAAAELVLVPAPLLDRIGPHLPGELCAPVLAADDGPLAPGHPLRFRHAYARQHPRRLDEPLFHRGRSIDTDAAHEAHVTEQLARRDWAGEITWRLTRLHELAHSRTGKVRARLREDIARLCPLTADVREALDEVADVGLPSIMEVIQRGVGAERSSRRSALTEGLAHRTDGAFDGRFVSLTWQHRMHPAISSFPRGAFYDAKALRDADTIGLRDAKLGWDWQPALGGRFVWLDVHGHEASGQNAAEVRAMKRLVEDFLAWTRRRGPRPGGAPWSLACLAFYRRQESAISEMLQAVTGQPDRRTRFSTPAAEIVCGTVDRFQGREADVVLLSMRNTARIGFLDSVNRLNVAITRARQQLVVLGAHRYFLKCRVDELEDLAAKATLRRSTP